MPAIGYTPAIQKAATHMQTHPETISANQLGELLKQNPAAHVVDVRTPAEYEECHVSCAKLAPLDALDPRKILDALQPADAPIYLLCKSGKRASQAAEKFRAAGIANVCVVEGGTDACVSAGLAVFRGKKIIPLDGQVRIGIGAFILLLWLLARTVHPGFHYVILAMAGALIWSGITGFCGMALLLAKAPWNQRASGDGGCRIC